MVTNPAIARRLDWTFILFPRVKRALMRSMAFTGVTVTAGKGARSERSDYLAKCPPGVSIGGRSV